MNKTKFHITLNAPVTLTFAAACFIVTLLGIFSGGRITQAAFMTWRASFRHPMTWLRLFTHVLGHDGMAHFVGNASYILLLGPMLEEKYGSGKLAAVIALTAVVTALVNMLLFTHTALCGASGIVFAFILLTSFTGFKDGEIPLTFILVAVIFLGQQIVEGITLRDNVANFTHIVGGLVGAGCGFVLNRAGKQEIS